MCWQTPAGTWLRVTAKHALRRTPSSLHAETQLASRQERTAETLFLKVSTEACREFPKSAATKPQAAAKDNHSPGTARLPVT